MISRETYLKLRDMIRRFEAARKKFDPKRYQRGGGYSKKEWAIISAMAGTRGTTYAETVQIEDYEWRMFPPSRYFAYYSRDMKKITGWAGNTLGRIIYKGPETRTFGGRRCNITVLGTNNVLYSGVCNLSGGTYCRLKRIKGRGPGMLPNKSKPKPKPKRRKAAKNPVQTVKHFMVVAASKNTNSFGLRGMVLMARNGEAWQVAANHMNVRKQGDLLRVPVRGGDPDWAGLGYETPKKLPTAPANVAAEVWG
jgi:hypothetical protein